MQRSILESPRNCASSGLSTVRQHRRSGSTSIRYSVSTALAGKSAQTPPAHADPPGLGSPTSSAPNSATSDDFQAARTTLQPRCSVQKRLRSFVPTMQRDTATQEFGARTSASRVALRPTFSERLNHAYLTQTKTAGAQGPRAPPAGTLPPRHRHRARHLPRQRPRRPQARPRPIGASSPSNQEIDFLLEQFSTMQAHLRRLLDRDRLRSLGHRSPDKLRSVYHLQERRTRHQVLRETQRICALNHERYRRKPARYRSNLPRLRLPHRRTHPIPGQAQPTLRIEQAPVEQDPTRTKSAQPDPGRPGTHTETALPRPAINLPNRTTPQRTSKPPQNTGDPSSPAPQEKISDQLKGDQPLARTPDLPNNSAKAAETCPSKGPEGGAAPTPLAAGA